MHADMVVLLAHGVSAPVHDPVFHEQPTAPHDVEAV
jgi:hypothetical protein